jgi:hypothetical protein
MGHDDAGLNAPSRRLASLDNELLWEGRSADHHTWSVRLRFPGEWGVEAQILCDGEFVFGQRFSTRSEAVTWAEKERADLEDS